MIPPQRLSALLLAAFLLALPARAESGYEAWLRYAEIDNPSVRQRYESLPDVVVILGDSPVLHAAQAELLRGVRGMLGRTLRIEAAVPDENAILLGTIAQVKQVAADFTMPPDLKKDGFVLKTMAIGGHKKHVIMATNDRGVLYGVFALLRKIALREPIRRFDEWDNPYAPVRVIDQWDNLDGSITRGYAGRSIFWESGHVVENLSRAGDYARLLASLGINGCSINNVNADARAITADYLPELARVADVFRPWGVRLFVSVNFSSPRRIGGLDTFDPLEDRKSVV